MIDFISLLFIITNNIKYEILPSPYSNLEKKCNKNLKNIIYT